MSYIDIRWSGSPDAVTAALIALGDPRLAPEGATADPRIVAFGPTGQEVIAGRLVMFALLRVPEGTEIEAPEGVYAEPGRVHQAVTGVWMEGVPASVSLWKAKAIMAQTPHGEGTLLDAVDAMMAQADAPTKLWWEYGQEIEREHPRVLAVAQTLGIEDDLDDLFRAAAAIDLT